MADSKIQDLTDLSVPALLDGTVCIDDPDGTPLDRFLYLDRLLAMGGFIPGGRLTLTTGVPVTTADVTAAGTLYYTPYLHDRIRIYDGTRWKYYSFTERSLALTLTSGKPYDVWIYDNAGTLTLETLVWTDDTTRATALTTQDGVYVKTGATTRLYLGTIYASGANTTEDSAAKRYVWNMYHRHMRTLAALEGTDSWTYGTNAWRQVNAAAANQIEVMVGLAGQAVILSTRTMVACDNSEQYAAGIGYDSTTAPVTGSIRGHVVHNVVATSEFLECGSHLSHFPALGRHYYAWLETAPAGASVTVYGDNGGTGGVQGGMAGMTIQ